MREQVFTNARVVLDDDVVSGTVVVRDGIIRDVETGHPSQVAGAIDFDFFFNAPATTEIYTDNVEKHFAPRPGVSWPGLAAALAHDAQVAGAGITTVFDAVAVGEVIKGTGRREALVATLDAVNQGMAEDMFRSEHLIHLRCEISYAELLDLFEPLVDYEGVRLVSIMDHTPGQRQFADVSKYVEYYKGKFGLTDAEMDAFIADQQAGQRTFGEKHRRHVVSACRERGIPIASHDDATPEHVSEAIADGAVIAEFPTTVGAARAAHESGLKTLMGGPNVVLGGSHSGNVAASDLARLGLVDIVSSDYVPSSLVHAVFGLVQSADITLPDAVRMVTKTPAGAVGLTDRGEIRSGTRADLVQIAKRNETPVIRAVWRKGNRVS